MICCIIVKSNAEDVPWRRVGLVVPIVKIGWEAYEKIKQRGLHA